MPSKTVRLFLFAFATFMLLLKPMIGFCMYNRTIEIGSKEQVITLIKAFSKRKQEYQEGSSLSPFAVVSELLSGVPKPRIDNHFKALIGLFISVTTPKHKASKAEAYPIINFQKVYLIYQRFAL